ncbi:enoyl-CoA hydratase-related protein [Aquabacter spiritensis]|uniref:Enoyl-CoA hydratase/carnithine racemase n=1 Tax=Aquabacter spiritensis TaxID=933073 RepID=A0A4R3LK49_9HYPH|nr:enoyl-CoA hydratase-related protein [Aquabacter spiritensis]TCT00613.1 enoyl-CoA hydratase/carnithine racemase [Aquabacter spiritensis]
MATGDVSVTIEGGIARLTLSNPARRNAISSKMWHDLSSFAAEAGGRGDIRVALLRGEGTLAFSGGADISDFSAARSDAAGAQTYDELVESACTAIENLAFPVVALVRGACVGAGAALAASCDIRVAADDAFLAIPAARLGLGYDPRGVARLVRAFGGPVVRQLFFTATSLAARRAYEMGALDHLEPPDAVDAVAERIVTRISENAPLTLKAAKLSIRAAEGVGGGILTEARHVTQLANASADYREGRLAFAEKRAPRFTGT